MSSLSVENALKALSCWRGRGEEKENNSLLL